MRVLPLLLVALLMIPLVPAQTMTVTSAHQVRIAYGDIPSTDMVESDESWNVEQILLLDEGGNGTVTVPNGHALGVIHCGDGCDFDEPVFTAGDAGLDVTITCTAVPEGGQCAISIPHAIAGTPDAFGMSLSVGDDHTVFVYTPDGLSVASATENLVGDGFYYPGTQTLIHQYQSDDDRFWFTVSPQAVVEAPAGIDGNTVLWAGLTGLVVGVVLWYVLVAQGIVQKRQRKQVAGTAAHKEASKEGKATLEWRRRALLAAMKELEVARMDQTIDLDAYDLLKADFKRQTVTVMRALEELGE